MLKRILSAMLFIPVVLVAIFETWTGGVMFLAVLLVCAYLTAHEYFELVGADFSSASKLFGIVAVIATVSLCYILGGGLKSMTSGLADGELASYPELAGMASQAAIVVSLRLFALLLLFFSFCLLALFVIQIRREKFDNAFREVALSFLAVPYIGFGFGTLAILQALPEKGPWLVLLAFTIVWVTDSFALFVGRLVGRHRLGLAASPNKTVEGTIGGTLFGVGAAIALKLAFPVAYSGWSFLQWPEFIALALVYSIAGQIGDLAESVLKRSLGTKDSGSAVPGHGGLLDVFDAQLVVSPLMFGLVVLMAGMH